MGVLVLFPLLTGGVWWERPGVFIELSDVGIPVLLLGALAWGLQKGRGVSLRASRTVRLAVGLRDRVAAGSVAGLTPWKYLLGGWALFSTLGAAAALRRHWNFGSHSHDLGIFTNTLWNWLHGFGYVSGPKDGMNLFADHQSPILLALAPAFALFPGPETLLVLQAVGIAAGGVPLYFIARSYLAPDARRVWAFAFPMLYWGYLPLRSANLFDFHPEVFMLPLFLAAIAGLQSSRTGARVGGALALAGALACKESAGPVAVGVGLAWILGAGPPDNQRFTRRVGWVTVLLGLAVFVFDLKVVPRLLGSSYAYAGQYSQYGSGWSEILTFPFREPALLVRQLLGPARLKYLFWTLAPLAFLPLLHPRALVAALPGYAMLFLTQGDHRVSISWHYVIEAAVGLFWAAAGALRADCRRGSWGRLLSSARLGWFVLFWALGTHGRSDLFTIRYHERGPHARWLGSEFLPAVDPEVTLAVTETLVPHLSLRHWVHHLPHIGLPGRANVDCLIEDLGLPDYMMAESMRVELHQVRIPAAGYREVYSCGTLRVWSLSAKCLRWVPRCSEGSSGPTAPRE